MSKIENLKNKVTEKQTELAVKNAQSLKEAVGVLILSCAKVKGKNKPLTDSEVEALAQAAAAIKDLYTFSENARKLAEEEAQKKEDDSKKAREALKSLLGE